MPSTRFFALRAQNDTCFARRCSGVILGAQHAGSGCAAIVWKRVGIEAGVSMMMSGYLRLPSRNPPPVSLLPVSERMLREDLGFGGVVASADLGMGALGACGSPEVADTAVAAGDALLLFVIPNAAPEMLIDQLARRGKNGATLPERKKGSVARLQWVQHGRAA